jgi:hypothetical protein
VKVPFTWKVTGWFMVEWSPEFPAGETRPLRYFGEDLVADRDESGVLHVLEAHCKHLGARIGHGGTVVGDCVHRATVTPKMLDWRIVDQEWRLLTGWPDARSDDPENMALRIHSHMFGLGGAISAFEGSSNHRLIFACSPVDDECSNMFYSIWWPRNPGDASDIPPDELRERVCAAASSRSCMIGISA